MKKIYLILSHSGSIPSLIIKGFTRCKYSHVALALDESLDKMYTFGRKKVTNIFNGGFIIETLESEFYQKFKKTKCMIYSLNVTDKNYEKLTFLLEDFSKNADNYHYDIIGLIFKSINVKIKRKNHFVCTDFISYILNESDIYKFKKKVIKPVDFMNMPIKEIVYTGLLLNYNVSNINKKTIL